MMMSDFWARQKAGLSFATVMVCATGKALPGLVRLGRYSAVKGRAFTVDVER